MTICRILWLIAVTKLFLAYGLGLVFRVQRHPQIKSSSQFYAERDSYSSAVQKAAAVIRKRFFFPGHGARRSRDLFVENSIESVAIVDLPELDETDNIHSSEGPLLCSLERCQEIFRSKRSWYLVNGSTGGILAAILATKRLFQAKTGKSGIILVPRDSHKSVFDSLRLFELDAILLPIDIESSCQVSLGMQEVAIFSALQQCGEDQIMAMVITRPSYQGIMMPSAALQVLIQKLHMRGVAVIVDEAHGAHLPFFHDLNMGSALQGGADIVIQSAHKTLTSLSQTALMHLNHGAFSCYNSVQAEQVEHVLHDAFSSLTTTSPNSILLASLDKSVARYGSHGKAIVGRAALLVDQVKVMIRSEVGDVLELLDDIIASNPIKSLLVDPTRLSLRVRSEVCAQLHITSVDFDDTLCEEHDIYCELNLPQCITYIIPADIDESEMIELGDAIVDGAKQLRQRLQEQQPLLNPLPSAVAADADKVTAIGKPSLLRYLSPYDLKSMQARTVLTPDGSINKALIGHCSCETISVYPPGIPLIVQGEVISIHHLQELAAICKSLTHSHDIVSALGSGRSIVGNKDPLLATICIISS